MHSLQETTTHANTCRGPGALLGDDFLRERRMACSVIAATAVTTLRLPPHKLPQVGSRGEGEFSGLRS